jgi:prepilin-type N-terminal cleavage/methylation domain-containing protein
VLLDVVPPFLELKMKSLKAFTLIELMVTILILGILVSVTIPMFYGRIESAKWSEGSALAGTIRAAVRTVYSENAAVVSTWSNQAVSGVWDDLCFQDGDLSGTYFTVDNFTIDSVDSSGNAVISVSAPSGLSGSGLLDNSGWTFTPAD